MAGNRIALEKKKERERKLARAKMREKGTTNKQPTIGGGDLADCWLEEESQMAVGTRRRIERRGEEDRKSQENLHISKKSSTFAGANVLGKEKESKDK